MEAGHAGAASAAAPGIECTTRFALDEVRHEAMQRSLEYSLEAPEDEVATRGGVDDESQMVWQQVFGQGVTFDTSERGETADGAMSVRMNESEQIPAERLVLLLGGIGDLDSFEQGESRIPLVGDARKVVSGLDEMLVHAQGIESEQKCLGTRQ